MRHSLKKLTSAGLALTAAAFMMFGSHAAVYAEKASPDEETVSSAEETVEPMDDGDYVVSDEAPETEDMVEVSEEAALDDGDTPADPEGSADDAGKNSESVEEAVEEEEAAVESAEAAASETADPEELIGNYLKQMIPGITTAIAAFTDEELEQYKKSTDPFTVAAANAWEANKKELGALKEEQPQDAVTVEKNSDGASYTVTQVAAFENADAEFVYTVGAADGVPTDLAINVDLPMSVTMKRAALNTVMGLGTVFVMLVFLSFVISLFKLIPQGGKKKAEPEQAPVMRTAPSAPVAEEIDETDDQELVAVIAAAIAAAEGTSPDGFVVRSIRRAGRVRR